jgi:purine-binding chemotaxis protein CheW
MSPVRPMTPEEILHGRAQDLARPVAQPPRADLLQVLEFRIAGQAYAVETRHAAEVVALDELTPVPCTPAFVLGVFNLRGRITTLVEIRSFLGLPQRGLSDLGQVVVVRGAGLEFGFVCDRIDGVAACAIDELQAPTAQATVAGARHLKGLTPQGRLLLDLDSLLADPALIVHKESYP